MLADADPRFRRCPAALSPRKLLPLNFLLSSAGERGHSPSKISAAARARRLAALANPRSVAAAPIGRACLPRRRRLLTPIRWGLRLREQSATDQFLTGHGRPGDRLLQQTIEEHPARTRSVPVEAKGEFVQIVVQLRRSNGSLVRPQQPALERGAIKLTRGNKLAPNSAAGWITSCSYPRTLNLLYPDQASVLMQAPGSMAGRTAGSKLAAEAFAIRAKRSRPILRPSACAAISPKVLLAAPRPRFPGRGPPKKVSSTSTTRPGDLGPVAPSPAAACAASFRRCDNCPNPESAARPKHWHPTSDG